MVSPMYCITVTLYFLQSSQNCEAENFLLRKMVIPAINIIQHSLYLSVNLYVTFFSYTHERRIITPLDGSGHPDEEARAVIERQIDVEDVL